MEHDFWHKRWQEDQIGFHQPDVNPLLIQYIQRLDLGPGDEIFVPLCGKSLDMPWLHQQGYGIIGIELSTIALQAFFSENGIACKTVVNDDFTVYHAPGYTLYGGDFFTLQALALQSCKAVYDRAALVAFPPEMRIKYARHLIRILPRACSILLITLEYNAGEMQGPPFSVSYEEVVEMFGNTYNIDPLHENDALEGNARLRERGLTALRESVLLLTPKNPG